MSDAIKELKEKLLYKRVKTYEVMSEADMAASDEYAKGYMAFLDGGKTERECVSYAITMVEKEGYREGRPRVEIPEKFMEYVAKNEAGEISIAAACKEMGVARAHWYRWKELLA